MPCQPISVSQVSMRFVEKSVMKTWSKQVHFLMTLCWWVGIPLGSASSRPRKDTTSINPSALFNTLGVKRRVSLGLSQCGWWWLKLPTQMTCGAPASEFPKISVCVLWKHFSCVTVALLSPSRYMLKMTSLPQSPLMEVRGTLNFFFTKSDTNQQVICKLLTYQSKMWAIKLDDVSQHCPS